MGPGNEPGAWRAEQFLNLGNYTLTRGAIGWVCRCHTRVYGKVRQSDDVIRLHSRYRRWIYHL